MAEELQKNIGAGANYPIVLEPSLDQNGEIIRDSLGEPLYGWQIATGDVQLIEQSLKNIIYTLIGQRLREENFGCRLYEVLEEPNNRVIQHLASKFVTEAIQNWEPRLRGIRVEAKSEANKIYMKLYYYLRNSTNENSLTITYNI